MTMRLANLGSTDFADGEVFYADDANDTYNAVLNGGFLGEIKWFDLDVSGAITKASLQSRGWAIQDGTTSIAQGISGAQIATTRNMEHKFVRMSDDESSGTTGGEDTHTLTIAEMPAHSHTISNNVVAGGDYGHDVSYDMETATSTTSSVGSGTAHENRPAFIELVAFAKVKYTA